MIRILTGAARSLGVLTSVLLAIQVSGCNRLLSPETKKRLCNSELHTISRAKELYAHDKKLQAGAAIQPTNLFMYLPESWHTGSLTNGRCRSGGTYFVGAVGDLPKCSVHGYGGFN